MMTSRTKHDGGAKASVLENRVKPRHIIRVRRHTQSQRVSVRKGPAKIEDVGEINVPPQIEKKKKRRHPK